MAILVIVLLLFQLCLCVHCERGVSVVLNSCVFAHVSVWWILVIMIKVVVLVLVFSKRLMRVVIWVFFYTVSAVIFYGDFL